MTDENENEDFDFYRKLAMLEYEFRKLRKKTKTPKVDLRNYDAAESAKKLKELRHSNTQNTLPLES